LLDEGLVAEKAGIVVLFCGRAESEELGEVLAGTTRTER
jgi:hypothetical protein